jgi:glutaredoxin 3
MSAGLVLYGTASCPFTTEMREQLLWDRREFVEHDVEADAEARGAMLQLTGGDRTVPVLVENGRVIATGWRGRGCTVSRP